MKLAKLLEEVSRPCSTFQVGGFRPSEEIQESWLGRVSHFLPEEDIPIDKHGKRMIELGQFYLLDLPYVPDSLSDIVLLTVFISSELEGDSDLMDDCFLVREYKDISALIRKEVTSKAGGLKAFPLKVNPVEQDYPVWDGGGLTPEQEDAFIALEGSNEITDYFDVTSHTYGHKFGGYPSFCQPGVDLDPHEFVFQVSSDSKIQLNVIDGGNLTFWRHPVDGSWKIYYDFY